VIHSGTVGAALTAASYGTRGLAVSMELGQPRHWEASHELVRTALRALAASPVGTTLNLNIPNRPVVEIRACAKRRWTPSAPSSTRWRSQGEGFVKLAYAEPAEAAPPGSDAALLAEGFATVTALQVTAELHVDELDDLLAE
jgi:5'-nucleotidase